MDYPGWAGARISPWGVRNRKSGNPCGGGCAIPCMRWNESHTAFLGNCDRTAQHAKLPKLNA